MLEGFKQACVEVIVNDREPITLLKCAALS